MSAPPALPAAPPLSGWFFLALGLAGLAVVGLGLGLIFELSPADSLDRLRGLRYHDSTFRFFYPVCSVAGFQAFRWGLLGLGVTSGLGLAAGARKGGWLRREARALRREWQALAVLAPWRALAPAERRVALLLLGGLTLLRVYWVLHYPLYGDELVTYLSFVRPGAVAAVSVYPIPNNHVLYSLLCWLASLVSANGYWVLRLPTFLIGTLGPVLVGLGLLRRYGWRVAAGAVLLGGLFPYALFQSVVGRGYGLLAVSGQLGLLATLALGGSPGRPRLAWALWVAVGVVGCYAVPTGVLHVAALAAWLGWRWRRQPGQLAQLAAALALTGSLLGLLYAPVLLVSGPGALLHNTYVAPGAGQAPGLTLWSFAARTEGQLLGLGWLALPLAVALTVVALAWVRRLPAGRVGHRLPGAVALVVWLPYLLLAARAVYPPARVLAYREFYLLLLALLLADTWWRQRQPAPGRPWLTLALPMLLAAIGLQVPFPRRAAPDAQLNQRVADTYAWLRQHGARAVLADHPHYQLYLVFFNQQAAGPLAVDARPQPGRRYQFQLLDREGPGRPLPGATLAATTADVQLWRLSVLPSR